MTLEVKLPDGTPVQLLRSDSPVFDSIQPCWKCGSEDQEILEKFNSAVGLAVFTHLVRCKNCGAQRLQKIKNAN